MRVFSFVGPPQSPKSGRILVGTASWSDPGFVERWYPPKLPAGDRLPWYAEHFEMVEVNSTFYAVPEVRLVERWVRATPNEFVFDVKLHRLLSRHAATLRSLPPALQRVAEADAGGKVKLTADLERALLEQIVAAIEPLRAAQKFGAFLLQLSPAFSPRKHDLAELDGLLARLAPLGAVVELRNRHWTEDGHLTKTLEFFRRHHTTFALVDAPAEAHFTIMPSDLDAVTRRALAYLRLHGRDAQAYLRGRTVAERFSYDYSDEEIGAVAERAKKLAREAEAVHVVFNNNALDFAPHAALRLRAALGQITKGPPREGDLFR
ncbi:MAG TPA: DUF72 domain-containing protein [Chthoniobacterales bacterium]|nr:DUF72 domain-containing protein [Chthoniobacterales bacterium]